MSAMRTIFCSFWPSLTLGALLCLMAGSCAHNRDLKTVDEAWALRGLERSQVDAAMGTPNDVEDDRAFWFLSTESKNHPAPTPELHEFLFSKGRLISIKKAGSK